MLRGDMNGNHLMLDNMPRGTICIEDLEIGMTRNLRKLVTDRDIELFAEVSTDRNPVHLDDAYAQDTIFQGRIAHGMLTAGLISAVIGEQLPGHGTVYLGQSLKFMAPVRPGDTVEVAQAPHRLRLVHPPSYQYFSLLRDKLHWGRGPSPAKGSDDASERG